MKQAPKEINYRPVVNMSLVFFGLWQLGNGVHLAINHQEIMTKWDWMVFWLPGFLMICTTCICYIIEWAFKKEK